MRNFTRGRLFSFKYAFSGLRYVIISQRNAWIHAAVTLLVVILAAMLSLTLQDWGLLLLAIGLVWTAEIFNTALEALVDLVSPQPHPLAKIVKDTSAAAVLVSAIISVIIGLLILLPPLVEKIVR
ncbi:MAG: diacylglycerol kinase family protein [Chloroflexi bacterium]|nr:MAG: diacylglycerol kinase family protein [Chloroflexota bacterium]